MKQHEKNETQKNCYSASRKKVQYEKNAIRKKVQHGQSTRRKKYNTDGKSKARNECNPKSVQHEKNAT